MKTPSSAHIATADLETGLVSVGFGRLKLANPDFFPLSPIIGSVGMELRRPAKRLRGYLTFAFSAFDGKHFRTNQTRFPGKRIEDFFPDFQNFSRGSPSNTKSEFVVWAEQESNTNGQPIAPPGLASGASRTRVETSLCQNRRRANGTHFGYYPPSGRVARNERGGRIAGKRRCLLTLPGRYRVRPSQGRVK